MQEGGRQVESFVPELARRRIVASIGDQSACRPETFPAAVVFADVSGFTRLASSLSELGAEGAEQLTQLLNAYYGALIDLIDRHGGDVVRFAGDSLLAVWPAGGGIDSQNCLAEQVRRAAECCLEVQSRLTGFRVTDEVRLSLRVSITADELTACHIGGVQDHWQLAVLGPPLEQLRLADARCPVGAVMASPQAVEAAQGGLIGERFEDGFLLLRQLVVVPEPRPLSRVSVQPVHRSRLRQFVPETVLARIDAGQEEWLADLLHVAVVFLQLSWPEAPAPANAERLHTAMRVLQAAAARCGGEVLQLMIDDKGTVGIVAFGLPPRGGEGRAARALAMVEGLAEPLGQAGIRVSAGVAAGEAFCGPLGGAHHQQYTVIGNVMNLAARLMQHAQGDTRCDMRVQRESSGKFCLEPLAPVRFKGFAEPQPVFRLAPGRVASNGPELSPATRECALVGRSEQIASIRHLIESCLTGQNARVMVEGEPGIGKSELLGATSKEALELGVTPLVGECSLIEPSTAYYPWRQVFSQLLELDREPSLEARQKRLFEHLPSEHHRLAPLLNPLLDVKLPVNEIIEQLAGKTWADNLHEVLIALLRNATAQRGPLAILLDDMQWADSASWDFTLLALRQVRPITVALFLREPTSPYLSEYEQWVADPGVQRIKLALLSAEQVAALIGARLQVGRVTPRLAALVYDRSQGNPFFAEEIVNLLQTAGALQTSNGVADLAGEASIGVPERINDLITSRVNQLPPPERLTLQVASVVGRVFRPRVLADVYPVRPQSVRVGGYLEALEERDLVRTAAPLPEPTMAFRHGAVQQVAYRQLPRRQRRLLHQRIARWHEASGDESTSRYPLLAHHWGAGGDIEQELKYLDLAGDQALRNGAGHEAFRHFQQARDRLADPRRIANARLDPPRDAHWARLLGESSFVLGDLDGARRFATESLRLLGEAAPESPFQLTFDTLKQLAVQLTHRALRLRPRKSGQPFSEGEHRRLEAALACQRIAQICYFTNDITVGVNRTLTALNLAERVPESPVLAVSYASTSIIATLLRIDRLARLYAVAAERVGRDVNDLPALAYTLAVVGMYWLGRGDWDRVRRISNEAIEISERLGDHRQLAESVTVLAMLNCFRGNYDDSRRQFDRVRWLGEQADNDLHAAWGHCGRGECLYREGKLEAARGALEKAWTLLQNRKDRTEEIRAAGLLAIVNWRLQHPDDARRHADAAEGLIAESPHVTVSTLEGLAGLAEARLGFWADHPTDGVAQKRAHRSVALMKRFARVFPIGVPRALRLRGEAATIAGRPRLAQRLFANSLSAADRLGLQLESQWTREAAGR